MAEALADPARATTQYASVQAMAEWLAARRGEARFAYATGPALDPRAGAVLLARRWVAEGKVVTVQKRLPSGPLQYLLERLSISSAEPGASLDSGPGGGGERGAPEPDQRPVSLVVMLAESSDEGRIYRLVSRCANLDLRCPSNEQIAQMLDLPNHRMLDRQGVAHKFRGLVKRGLLEYRRDENGQLCTGAPGCPRRRVRIVASGKVTA